MKTVRIFTIALVLIIIMTACTPTEDPILTIGENTYTKSQLEALGIMDSPYTNKDGETTTFTGVSLTTLLTDAGINQSGKTLTYIAADGYEAETTVEEVMDCGGCIVAFDNDTLRLVMPELSSKLQVKDIIEISIK